MLAQKLLSSLSGAAETLYVDDVFSTYTYTGNGTSKTITNGIDLAGKGGMVWVKSRNDVYTHVLTDTNRGVSQTLITNNDSCNADYGAGSGLSAFGSTGFTVGGANEWNSAAALNYVSWTFRKAPKFFDVVTYTGNASAPRTIPHNLGSVPGMILIKATSTAGDWLVYHSGIGNANYLVMNTTAASAASGGVWNSTTPTSTGFTIGSALAQNTAGVTYVAYLFAHDSSADGVVQCGSFTVSGGTSGQVNLGWEPQYLLVKSSNTVQDWMVVDTTRKMALTEYAFLRPNTIGAEVVGANASFAPNATGFTSTGYFVDGTVLTYLAIRRPNKPPTLGTQVYNAIARTGNSSTTAVTDIGFAPDLVVDGGRSGGYWHAWWDRLRGANKGLNSSSTAAETALTVSLNSFGQNGITVGTDANQWINYINVPYINHFFKRAPGVFDVVCTAGGTFAESHSLGVVPELIISKNRTGAAANWQCIYGPTDSSNLINLNTTAAGVVFGNLTPWQNAQTFYAAAYGGSLNPVHYLFATKAGISKVGSYTGNGTSQTIDCGFTTGSRFVMIKRTDAAGDWYVWDTVRGLVAGNDPHLSLNSATAEITTDDSLDPASVGFIVNQLAATNINVTSASYIYLSFA